MVSSQYYCEVVLMQKDIKEFLDYFTYQQDSAHARCAKEMVNLLKRDTRLHRAVTVTS